MKLTQQFEWVVDSKENPLHFPIKEVWRYRDMLYFLALRDFKIRYKQSALGFLWAIFQPLINVVIYYLIFPKSLGVEFNGPYSIYFLCGFIPWNYFSKAFNYGSSSLVSEADLIKKVYFPRIIIPIATAISSLSDMLISFFILVIMLLFEGIVPSANLIWLPFFTILMIIYATALSLWFGSLNVRFRDVQILLPFLIQILFILTPIAYPIEKFPKNLHWFFTVNPMSGIVEGYRYSLLGSGQPFEPFCIVSYLFVMVVFLSGLYIFNRFQRQFADII